DLVLLDVIPLALGKHPPVDALHVVARHVLAVLREVEREPNVRRAVHPLHVPVHHLPRHQLHFGDLLERAGIEKRSGRGAGFGGSRGHREILLIDDCWMLIGGPNAISIQQSSISNASHAASAFVLGTSLRSRSMILSLFMPAASALKVVMIRW